MTGSGNDLYPVLRDDQGSNLVFGVEPELGLNQFRLTSSMGQVIVSRSRPRFKIGPTIGSGQSEAANAKESALFVLDYNCLQLCNVDRGDV